MKDPSQAKFQIIELRNIFWYVIFIRYGNPYEILINAISLTPKTGEFISVLRIKIREIPKIIKKKLKLSLYFDYLIEGFVSFDLLVLWCGPREGMSSLKRTEERTY